MQGPGAKARAAYARCLARTIANYAEAGHLIRVESEREDDELTIELKLSDPERFHELLSACLLDEGIGTE